MKRRSAILLGSALLVGGALVAMWAHWREPPTLNAVPQSAVSRPAFDRWVKSVPGRAADVAAFRLFLQRQGVADILPYWTLLRANANKSERCHADPFVLPPRTSWPNVIPALRLIRSTVIPAVGSVEVASVFRVPALNRCSRGATRSRHLTFAAIDLIPLDQPDAATGFSRLCAAWRRAGPASRWGLGAYIDPKRPALNRVGRFHVDATGWRSWGFSYRSASSGCALAPF